eukprot:m.106984 g.106984  ORF g.106984 m.106984 type:complete len:206 (+) comp37275_c0_seq2:568-1185(+)
MFSTTDIWRAFALEQADEKEGWSLKSRTIHEEYWYKIDYTKQVPLHMKCCLRLDGVPMKAALKLLTEPAVRNEWDRKVFQSEAVEDNGEYRVIYWVFHMPLIVKDRDMVQFVQVRYIPSEDCYLIMYKDGRHHSKPESDRFIRMKTGFSCSILRRDENDPNSTQLFTLGNNFYGGWLPDVIMPVLYSSSLRKFRQRLIKGYQNLQ